MAEEKKGKKKLDTAIKRITQNKKKQLINSSFKSKVRTAKTNLEKALETGEKETTVSCLNTFTSLVDKAVKRNIYTLNKASRIKSRTTKKVLAS